MGYKKVMKTERGKATSEVWRSDRQTRAFPRLLRGGSVDCELINGAGPQTVKVKGTGCQIPAQREILMGINQYLAHCYKYVAALQGRWLCKDQSIGFIKRPKRECCVTSYKCKTQWAVLYQSHTIKWVGVCQIAAEHCTKGHGRICGAFWSLLKHSESPLKGIQQKKMELHFICLSVCECVKCEEQSGV